MFHEKEVNGLKFVVLDEGATPDDVIKHMIETKGTNWTEGPVLITHLDEIIAKYRKWKKLLPDIAPFYAVKCDPHLIVVRLLSFLGASFDCASKTEAEKILQIGVHPKQIVAANPYKTEAQIKLFEVEGVDLLVVDTVEEMLKIIMIHPKARLLLRVFVLNVGAEMDGFGTRFGVHIKQVKSFLEQAKKVGADIVGLCFMAGRSFDPRTYSNSVKMCKPVFDMAASLGFNFNILDIGGNFYGAQDELLEQISTALKSTIAECFPLGNGVRVMAEPGRFFVETSGTLYTAVIGKRDRESMSDILEEFVNEMARKDDHQKWLNHNKETAPEFAYVINDSIFNNFALASFGGSSALTNVKPLNQKAGNDQHHLSRIYGMSCAGPDLVVDSTQLPELQVGDWLAFRNKGHYLRPMRTTMNELPVVIDIFTVSKKFWDIVANAMSATV